MNPTAILGLISDLYAQIEGLSKENEALRAKQGEADVAAIRSDPLGGPEEAAAQARRESES